MKRARAIRAGALAASALLFISGAALADAGDSSDVRTLEMQLDEAHAALSTSDCNAACRALGSIRRAADKICALEPGPRCDAAREKAADATRRVRDACPDCVIASAPLPSPPPDAHDRTATRASEGHAPAELEASRGGCRSCSAIGTSTGGGDLGVILVAGLAAVRVASRRSKKDRQRL